MKRKAQKHLITGALLRLMIANMLLATATCACGLIDNLFIGQNLDSDALAAVGFFSPVATSVGFAYVIISGAQILTGNLVGAGETKKVNRLFISSFSVLAILFAAFSAGCFLFREGLAARLGADDRTYAYLCDYIKGYAPGILPQTLAALLMALCSFNNDLNRSYYSIGTMIVGNLVGDWLLIGEFGLFGVGLASTISSTAALAVLLPGFLKKDKLFHFQRGSGIDLKLIGQAARRGIPSLMLTGGVIIKNLSFNFALDHHVGAAGVAVAGIMATVSALTGAVSSGCYNAFSTFAGIYFGEEDRDSLLDLARSALCIGIITCGVTTVLIMALSTPLSWLFVPDDAAVRALAERMFLLAFTYLVPNVIFNIFLQSYWAQNRMLLVNIMSFAETAAIGLLTLVTVGVLGADAAWLSNTVIDVLCIVVVMISVIVYWKRCDLSLPAMLKLPPDFGAKQGEFITFSVERAEDVTKASERVIGFCIENAYPKSTANHVGLCIEEIAANILYHGFHSKRHCYADIRVVSKGGRLTVRVRDNCREFDPRKRMELYDPAHPEKNIGIRIVCRLATEIDYYNNAGINTLIMKFLGDHDGSNEKTRRRAALSDR